MVRLISTGSEFSSHRTIEFGCIVNLNSVYRPSSVNSDSVKTGQTILNWTVLKRKYISLNQFTTLN